MSSRLLPRRAQAATPSRFTHAYVGSNLVPRGSSQVAGWVAGWIWKKSLTYETKELRGSRCSTFVNKLRIRKEKGGKKRIGITRGTSCYTCYPVRRPTRRILGLNRDPTYADASFRRQSHVAPPGGLRPSGRRRRPRPLHLDRGGKGCGMRRGSSGRAKAHGEDLATTSVTITARRQAPHPLPGRGGLRGSHACRFKAGRCRRDLRGRPLPPGGLLPAGAPRPRTGARRLLQAPGRHSARLGHDKRGAERLVQVRGMPSALRPPRWAHPEQTEEASGVSTRTELLAELDQLDARIQELRGARAHIVYDLEWAVKERDRLRRHLASLDQDESAA